jgi:protein gp37
MPRLSTSESVAIIGDRKAEACIQIVVGGESGNTRRPFHEEWARNILRECRERNMAFFMKQFGGRTPTRGKAAIPPELMIQEFPQ